MSYSDEEVCQLKILLQDVLDENFLRRFSEMKDRLMKSQQTLETLVKRVEFFEEELRFYNDCDDCLRIKKFQHHAATQTDYEPESKFSGNGGGNSQCQPIKIVEPQIRKESRPGITQDISDLSSKRPRRDDDEKQEKRSPEVIDLVTDSD